MIRTLTIRNIALIEEATIDFHHGLNVLSGETGAGKSIILYAVNLILGGRADKNMIRSGCERASVEAIFESVSDPSFNLLLTREAIENNGDAVVLSREFSLNGKNICRMNGSIVSAAVLKEASVYLINLHGQNEHQFLADETKQLFYLDQLDNRISTLKERVHKAYDLFIQNHRYYAKLVRMDDGRERRIDILKHELDEIKRTNYKPGEEKRIAEESKRMERASRIHENLFTSLQLIGNGEEKGDSLHNLQSAVKNLRHISAEDNRFAGIADQCESVCFTLEDILYQLELLNHDYDYDPAALQRNENRLESILAILRKYGPEGDDVLKAVSEMENEYELLAGLDHTMEKTRHEHKTLLAQYRSAARELSDERKKASAAFEKKMIMELKDLGMEKTVFEVSFLEDKSGKPVMPSPEGDDRICFMICPNPGEPLKPISQIASGGELSRLMLALKTVESVQIGAPTMIFDEIDTGISGRAAQAVAEKLFSISRKQQVICISHLPQISSVADHQYLVYKDLNNQRTCTHITELAHDERVREIARMISGADGISEDALQYAAMMIDSSAKKKKNPSDEAGCTN